jgi:hypothetical protein
MRLAGMAPSSSSGRALSRAISNGSANSVDADQSGLPIAVRMPCQSFRERPTMATPSAQEKMEMSASFGRGLEAQGRDRSEIDGDGPCRLWEHNGRRDLVVAAVVADLILRSGQLDDVHPLLHHLPAAIHG